MLKKYDKPQLIDLSFANASGTCNSGSTPGTDCIGDGSSATGDCTAQGSSANSQCETGGSVSHWCQDGTSPGAYCATGSDL